jgi:hypothetical protein
MALLPIRIQRSRQHKQTIPAVYVGRPGKWGNPFLIGGLYKIGNGASGFGLLRCLDEKYNNGTFTEMKTVEQCVEWHKEYLTRYPRKDISELTGKNLSCWCKVGDPCHADLLLKLANDL